LRNLLFLSREIHRNGQWTCICNYAKFQGLSNQSDPLFTAKFLKEREKFSVRNCGWVSNTDGLPTCSAPRSRHCRTCNPQPKTAIFQGPPFISDVDILLQGNIIKLYVHSHSIQCRIPTLRSRHCIPRPMNPKSGTTQVQVISIHHVSLSHSTFFSLHPSLGPSSVSSILSVAWQLRFNHSWKFETARIIINHLLINFDPAEAKDTIPLDA